MSERPRRRSRSMSFDRRGLSEGVALAVLVAMVVATTGAAGIYVLVTGEEDDDEVDFSFQYYGESNSILVTYAQGEALPAGEIRVEGPDNENTWAEAGNVAEDEPIDVGDAVQLSNGNDYGSTITSGDTFQVYRVDGANRTELSTWTAGD